LLRTLGATFVPSTSGKKAPASSSTRGEGSAIVINSGRAADLAIAALRAVRKTDELASTPAIIAVPSRQVARSIRRAASTTHRHAVHLDRALRADPAARVAPDDSRRRKRVKIGRS